MSLIKNKLDPRSKFLFALVASIVLIVGDYKGYMLYVNLVLTIIPLFLLLSMRLFKVSLIYLGISGSALLVSMFLLTKISGGWNIALSAYSGFFTRMTPMYAALYYIFKTTELSELVAAMERMKMPQKIIVPLSVMFRFFPTIACEYQSIKSVMKMRGVKPFGKIRNPIELLEYRFVPLLSSILLIGDELSASALSKGLGSPIKRTNICEVELHLWDFVLIVVSVACLVLFLLARVIL